MQTRLAIFNSDKTMCVIHGFAEPRYSISKKSNGRFVIEGDNDALLFKTAFAFAQLRARVDNHTFFEVSFII